MYNNIDKETENSCNEGAHFDSREEVLVWLGCCLNAGQWLMDGLSESYAMTDPKLHLQR